MAPKLSLRAVTEADSAKITPPKSLKDAAERGERELLVSMRNEISDAVAGGVPPHTLAPLMRQLRDIDKEIRAFDMRVEQSEAESGYTVENTFDAEAL